MKARSMMTLPIPTSTLLPVVPARNDRVRWRRMAHHASMSLSNTRGLEATRLLHVANTSTFGSWCESYCH
jgi:hypothetical protein